MTLTDQDIDLLLADFDKANPAEQRRAVARLIVEVAVMRRAVKALRPCAGRMMVCHHSAEHHESAVVDGELEHWTVDDGCIPDCPGCAAQKERDAALRLADAVLATNAALEETEAR